jgi:hypothetical protein
MPFRLMYSAVFIAAVLIRNGRQNLRRRPLRPSHGRVDEKEYRRRLGELHVASDVGDSTVFRSHDWFFLDSLVRHRGLVSNG